MKNSIYTLFLFVILSCTSSKELATNEIEFKIVNTPFVVENDTIYINELRIYKIKSALDGMKLMYQDFGKWDTEIGGKHQNNINRLVWQNVKLIDGDNTTFTVIADGAETRKDYFTCFMVFDSQGNDCFTKGHPYQEQLIKKLVDTMNKID
jgi:hypothetical protein